MFWRQQPRSATMRVPFRYVGAGYAIFGGGEGNVLLASGVD